jgi:hypothetical protein
LRLGFLPVDYRLHIEGGEQEEDCAMHFGFQNLSRRSLAALLLTGSSAAAIAADLAPLANPASQPAYLQLPAVDGINGKAEMFGGGTNVFSPGLSSLPGYLPPFSARDEWRGFGGGAGSISAPLSHDFGAQFDALIAPWNGAIATGGAAHAFWRDPAFGLLGLYGSGVYWAGAGGMSVGRVAGEGEAYFGSFTLKSLVGAEFFGRSYPAYASFGLTPFGAPYVFAPSNAAQHVRFSDKVTLSYYLTGDFALSAGHSYTGGRNAAVLGAEYLIRSGGGVGASLFVEGRVGERYANSVTGGLRLYFGNSDKPLIRRHREDDPGNYLSDDLNALSNSLYPQTNSAPQPISSPRAAPPV